MKHEEILTKVHEELEAKHLNFEAKMAETFALVDGVYVPTGSFTPVRTDKTGSESIITGKGFSDHYTPIQNEEAFSVLGDMADVADIEFVNVANDIFTDSEIAYKRLAERKVTMTEVREAMARCLPLPNYWRGTSDRTRSLWEKHVVEMVERFNDADGGSTEKMTGWNLYNAIQGYNQHNTKKTTNYEKSLLMGKIANFSESSLNVVNGILFDGDNEKTSSKEFDQIFKKVA